MQLEYAAYDCELQHSIFGSSQILQGGCMMYETMQGVIGEEIQSLRLRDKNDHVTNCIFTALDGGLMLGVSGPIQILHDVLSILRDSIQMRYGCYKALKPSVDIEEEDPGKYAKLRAASLLNNPTFLPIIHSISSHISSCSSILVITHPLYNPRIPYRPPTIASFTNSMRFITKRVLDNHLLGSALYLNRENFITVASTLPSEIDPIVRLVALALSSETMARKTTVSQVYLNETQIKLLLESSIFIEKEHVNERKRQIMESEVVCEHCKLRKLNIVVTVNKGFAMVELSHGEMTQEYLERSELENLAGMESLSSFYQLEGRKTDLVKLRIDYDSSTTEPSKLWSSKINDQLMKCINLEKINSLQGFSNTMVVPEGEGNDCYFCSQNQHELSAVKTNINELDRKIYY